MTPVFLFISTILFYNVVQSAGQSALKQYFQIAGVPTHSNGITALPTVGYQRQATPNGVAALPNAGIAAVPKSGLAGGYTSSGLAAVPSSAPNAGISGLGALASLPGLIQALTATATASKPAASGPKFKPQVFQPPSSSILPTKQNSAAASSNGGLDAGVLNNLAIALQLLIVSNMLNSNLPENEANPIYELLEAAKSIPNSLSQTQKGSSSSSSSQSSGSYQEPSFDAYLPNANFVGTAGFAEGSITDPYVKPASRNSFQLMSPYEALGPSSPFSDPILGSPYGSIMSSKKDFQSPYVMMDSDPFFGMNDLF